MVACCVILSMPVIYRICTSHQILYICVYDMAIPLLKIWLKNHCLYCYKNRTLYDYRYFIIDRNSGQYATVRSDLYVPLFTYVFHFYDISMTSKWARWRLKSAASRSFTQLFIQAQVNENIKTPRHWPLWGEFTGDRWIPRTNGQ